MLFVFLGLPGSHLCVSFQLQRQSTETLKVSSHFSFWWTSIGNQVVTVLAVSLALLLTILAKSPSCYLLSISMTLLIYSLNLLHMMKIKYCLWQPERMHYVMNQ